MIVQTASPPTRDRQLLLFGLHTRDVCAIVHSQDQWGFNAWVTPIEMMLRDFCCDRDAVPILTA